MIGAASRSAHVEGDFQQPSINIRKFCNSWRARASVACARAPHAKPVSCFVGRRNRTVSSPLPATGSCIGRLLAPSRTEKADPSTERRSAAAAAAATDSAPTPRKTRQPTATRLDQTAPDHSRQSVSTHTFSCSLNRTFSESL